MKTLTVTINDEVYEQIEAEARTHGMTIEEEIVRRCEPTDWRNRPLIVDRDELAREVDAFHRDLAARGVSITAKEANDAIKEARR